MTLGGKKIDSSVTKMIKKTCFLARNESYGLRIKILVVGVGLSSLIIFLKYTKY